MGTRFNLVGLFVGDLRAMVAFYRDVLGVEIDWDEQGPYAEFKHEGIRFAMYERGRLAKWTSLNECRRSLPKGGASKRSQSADPTLPTAKSKLGSTRLSTEGSAVSLGKSWIANELAKTTEIASRGQVPQPAPSRLRYGVRLPSA